MDCNRIGVEAAPVGLLGIDGTGCIVFANAGAEALFGYEPGSLTGRFADVLVPGLLGVAAPFAGCRQGVHRDGTLVAVDVALERVDTAGAVLVVATIRGAPAVSGPSDEELRAGSRLEAMARLAQLGHWRLDLATNSVFWSREVYCMYGRPETFVPSLDDALEPYDPDDRQLIQACIAKTIETGSEFTHEARIVRLDGSVRHIVACGQREHGAAGEPIGVFGVVKDVTDEKVAALERDEANARVSVATQAGRVGIWERDIATNRLVWDATMFALYGIDEAACTSVYESFLARIHPDDRERLLRQTAAAVDQRSLLDTEFRILLPDGRLRHMRASAKVICHSDGMPRRLVGMNWDVTEVRTLAEQLRAKAEQERATAATLRETNRLMEMAEQLAKVGYWRLNLETERFVWSDEMYRIYDVPRSFEPTLSTVIPFYHSDDREAVRFSLNKLAASGRPYTRETRVMRGDGTIRWIAVSGQAEAGAPHTVFGIVQDITARKHAERQREDSMLRANVAAQAAQVGIWEYHALKTELVWDETMYALYGVDAARFHPSYEAWAATLHADDRARVECDVHAALSGAAPYDTEFRIRRPSGEVRHMRALGTVLRGADGSPERLIGTNWDVTEVRLLAEQLQAEKDAATFAASHDQLTGLLNRRGLEALVDAHAGTTSTLLFMDIDGFKAVNDRGGHAAGDETLRSVAGIVRQVVRECDGLARVGGDEFVIVLLDVWDCRTTEKVIERISAAIGALHPLGADDATRIGVSVGVGRLDGEKSLDEALRESDVQLYQVKNEHRRSEHRRRTLPAAAGGA